MISSSKFDSSQIISDRHRPLNGRLSLSYDHISPQLRRRKFKPRERERGSPKTNERGTPNRFSVSHTMKIRPFGFYGLGTPTPSPSPQRNPFSSPPPSPSSRPPMPLQTINQGRNNAVETVSYSAPWSKKTLSCYARTATYTAGEVTIINPCTATRDSPKIAWNFTTYEIW